MSRGKHRVSYVQSLSQFVEAFGRHAALSVEQNLGQMEIAVGFVISKEGSPVILRQSFIAPDGRKFVYNQTYSGLTDVTNIGERNEQQAVALRDEIGEALGRRQIRHCFYVEGDRARTPEFDRLCNDSIAHCHLKVQLSANGQAFSRGYQGRTSGD